MKKIQTRIKAFASKTMVIGYCLLVIGMVSCTDTWNDHYDAGLPEGASDASLWSTIQSNGNLNNFARVMEETGYNAALSSSQVFTVFAPTDAQFTKEQADQIIALYKQDKQNGVKDKDNRAIKQFVQNHIALYNHSVAKSGADSVVMMNGKYLVLTPQTMGNSQVLTSNLLTANGLLFTLDKKVDYYTNVFEALTEDEDIDSVGNFMTSFNEYEFQASKSVAGGIEDGRTWYLDSVSVLTNDLFDYTDYINSEDSVFWMVVPTNRVYNELVAEYANYFNYDNEVLKRDSLCWVRPRLAVITGTVFSQTRNARKVGEEYVWNTDSAMSVNAFNYNMRRYAWGRSDLAYYQYAKPFAGGGVFADVEEIDCSNGKVLKSDDWHFDKTQTFFQEKLVEGESRNYLDGVNETTTNDPQYVSVGTWSPFYNKVSENRFAVIAPKGQSNGEVRFKLPGLLSNIGYDIYAVFVPAEASDSLATDTVPCKFTASISYHHQDGVESAYCYLPENDSTLSARNRHSFITDPTKVDSVLLVSDFKVPTCSYGLSDSQVILRLASNLLSAERRNHTYTAYMRIDCIIVKPHED